MTKVRWTLVCVVLALGSVQPWSAAFDQPTEVALEKIKEPDLAKELGRRGDRDQEWRKALNRFTAEHKLFDTVILTTLDPAVAEPFKKLLKEGDEIDRDNLDWIKKIVLKHGWPGKSLVGSKAAKMAFLIVQHAPDGDLEFQEECLRKMQAAPKGDVEPFCVAYLTDRILIRRGKKQRFGTQGIFKDGKIVVMPIEDEAKVDERRKEVGLGPLSEHLKEMEAIYKNADGVAPTKKTKQ
jgi:hypothetical protein